MNRYLVKERIFSWANKFDIKDEFGITRYVVEGKIFSIGKKLNFYDSHGNLVLNINQKLLRLLDEYDIYSGRSFLGKVSRQLSFFRPKYGIKSAYGDYSIDGSVLKHDFDIVKNRRSVARIRKKYISLSDTYTVDIDKDEDQAFILALVIILDQIHHDGHSGTSNNNVDNY